MMTLATFGELPYALYILFDYLDSSMDVSVAVDIYSIFRSAFESWTGGLITEANWEGIWISAWPNIYTYFVLYFRAEIYMWVWKVTIKQVTGDQLSDRFVGIKD